MLLGSLAGFAQADGDGSATKTGDKVPAFEFETAKGKKVSIADYKGKLVLINLFATWCPPCRKELPEMQKQIWEKHSKNEKFALFVFGREENWDVLVPFKEKFKYTFPILPDVDRGVFSKFATQSIPRNILIDETGTIIYQSIGYEPGEFKKLVELIDGKLGK
jgi:peroxiredoxin